MKAGNILKTYILQITGGALLAVFADIFSPSGWKKYISVITGIILITIIMTPVSKLGNIDTQTVYGDFCENSKEKGEEIYTDLLKKEFSERLAADIKERIRTEFSKDVSAKVFIEMNASGGISEITKIIITGIKPDKKISDRISYIYDVNEVIINAV